MTPRAISDLMREHEQAGGRQAARREVYRRLVHHHECCNKAIEMICRCTVNCKLLRDLRAEPLDFTAQDEAEHGLRAYRKHTPPANRNTAVHTAVREHLEVHTRRKADQQTRVIIPGVNHIVGKRCAVRVTADPQKGV